MVSDARANVRYNSTIKHRKTGSIARITVFHCFTACLVQKFRIQVSVCRRFRFPVTVLILLR